MQLEITTECFMACKMCPKRGNSYKMNLPEFKEIINTLHRGTDIILGASGDPTSIQKLPEYIKYAADKGLNVHIYSNGAMMQGNYMKRCVDSGLYSFRFFVLGWNCETYQKNMGRRLFRVVRENAVQMQNYIQSSGSSCLLKSVHFVITNKETCIQNYQTEFINITNSSAEIWEAEQYLVPPCSISPDIDSSILIWSN